MAGPTDKTRLLETGCCKMELVPRANVVGRPTSVIFEVVLHGNYRWRTCMSIW